MKQKPPRYRVFVWDHEEEDWVEAKIFFVGGRSGPLPVRCFASRAPFRLFQLREVLRDLEHMGYDIGRGSVSVMVERVDWLEHWRATHNIGLDEQEATQHELFALEDDDNG